MMSRDLIVHLLKMRVGVASDSRDVYFNHLVDSVIHMLDDEKGINAELDNPVVADFVINYATWIHESKGEMGGMPRHLQYALNNLMIHNQKVIPDV